MRAVKLKHRVHRSAHEQSGGKRIRRRAVRGDHSRALYCSINRDTACGIDNMAVFPAVYFIITLIASGHRHITRCDRNVARISVSRRIAQSYAKIPARVAPENRYVAAKRQHSVCGIGRSEIFYHLFLGIALADTAEVQHDPRLTFCQKSARFIVIDKLHALFGCRTRYFIVGRERPRCTFRTPQQRRRVCGRIKCAAAGKPHAARRKKYFTDLAAHIASLARHIEPCYLRCTVLSR